MLRFYPLQPRLICFIGWLIMSLTGLGGSVVARELPLPIPERITHRQGLPQAFVPSILQDRQGFIWSATRDGLCRYDGQQVKVFQPDPDGRPSLSFTGLEQLILDPRGQIWIVSERGDIDRFDPHLETFVNLSRQPAFRRLVGGRSLTYRLRIDRQDRLWLMVPGQGLICWHLKTNQGQWFRHEPAQAASLSSNEVTDLFAADDGMIWLATTAGLDRLEPTTGQVTHFRHQPANPRSLPDNHLVGLYKRSNGEIALLSHYHLSLLQPRTGLVRTYPLPTQGNHWQDTHFASDSQGAIYFDQNNLLFQFTDETGVQVAAQWKQPIEACASLFIDQTDVLWVGTNGAGMLTYDLQPSAFQTRRYEQNFHLDLLTSGSLGIPPVSPSAVSSLKGLNGYNFRSTFDAHGRLWFNVGSSDLYRLDPKTGQTTSFPLPVGFRSERAGGTSCPLATDPQGRIWAVYGQEAFWFDEVSTRWIRWSFPLAPQPASDLLALVIDEQALWLASRAGGLWRVDRRTGQRQSFTHRPGDATSLSSNALLCLSSDPANSSYLWIGTFGSGLCRFDKRTGRCRRIMQADGLPDHVIYSALCDQQGYVWIGTNKGLCRLNRHTFASQTFTADDGLLADEFNRNHYLQLPGGRIILGGLEGFTVFDPAQLRSDRYEPRVELTELDINNQPIRQELPSPGDSQRPRPVASPLGGRPIQATHQLRLAYNQNYITVHFAALQFNRPAKNRYRYRLDGLEEHWTPTNRPEAVYTNLPPGTYVLLLNAANTSGKWSRYVRKLAITINPPVWATWWAISLYWLGGLGLGWGLVLVWLNRLRLQQTIRFRQQEAEQLRTVDTLKTTFFTNITHELRTPLTLILASAQQMLGESRPVNDASRLTTIDRQVHQLLGLINQWLDFSKLEAGSLPIQLVQSELNELVGEWIGSFVPEAQLRAIELSYQSTLAGSYWFDLAKLERIVSNLLSNALKFTPNGGQIRVELQPASTEGILLTVADTGVGIPADALPHIFRRYYQADNPPVNYPVQPGSGIGLALVQELVALQGGTISVQSTPGEGTEFTVWLPYTPAIPLPNSQPTTLLTTPNSVPAGEAAWPELPAGETPLILLVEDNPELADLIAQSLPPIYRIDRAANGQQGFEQVLALLPDLIISDVLMPVLDGYGLCQRLKADIRTNHVPIILLTARASLDSRLEGLSLGADDYLTKPFHVRELQMRVSNLLAQRHRLREHIRASLTSLDVPAPASVAAPTDPFITQLYTLLEAHLDQSDFGVDQLARQVGMSRSYLFRKVKALTGLSASELERNYRLQRATQYLQQGHGVAQTAYLVGFETPTYFTQSFRKLHGMTPTDYLRQPNHPR